MEKVNITEKLGIKLAYYQPNTKFEDEGNKDCAIRAVSKLLEISWDEAFKLLYKHALDIGTTLNYVKCIGRAIAEYGYIKDDSIRKFKHKLVDLLLDDEYKSGKYLICIANPPHAIAYIDGVVYDTNLSLDPLLISKILCIYKFDDTRETTSDC